MSKAEDIVMKMMKEDSVREAMQQLMLQSISNTKEKAKAGEIERYGKITISLDRTNEEATFEIENLSSAEAFMMLHAAFSKHEHDCFVETKAILEAEQTEGDSDATNS